MIRKKLNLRVAHIINETWHASVRPW